LAGNAPRSNSTVTVNLATPIISPSVAVGGAIVIAGILFFAWPKPTPDPVPQPVPQPVPDPKAVPTNPSPTPIIRVSDATKPYGPAALSMHHGSSVIRTTVEFRFDPNAGDWHLASNEGSLIKSETAANG
jgi:hypothetical protein